MRRPTFVGSIDEEKGVVKLSGRSFGDYSIAKAITRTRDMLLAGGGHAAAGGVTVALRDLEWWAQALSDYYWSLKLDATEQLKYLFSQPDIVIKDLKEIGFDFIRELALLEPFGTANPSVAIQLDNCLINRRRLMGREGKHLSLDVADAQGDGMRAVAFNADPEALDLTPGDHASLLILPRINEWHGAESVEGIIERVL